MSSSPIKKMAFAPRSLRMLALAGIFSLTSGALMSCDKFTPPAGATPSVAEKAEQSRSAAKSTLSAVMKAAQNATSTCVAADLHWEADVSGTTIPHHFSRPCIPVRCDPKPPELDALRSSVAEAKKLVEGDTNLQIPSFQGFLAISEATLSFVDTALAGKAKSPPNKDTSLVLSGLSMHYSLMAAAFREIYKDSDIPLEPPSLKASLEVPEPGGDVCKGWALPRYCDVKAVQVPKERKWRTDPVCIEVESVMK